MASSEAWGGEEGIRTGQHDEARGSQGVKGGGQSQEGIQGGRCKAGSRSGGVWAQSIDI